MSAVDRARERVQGALSSVTDSYEALSEREQRLIMVLGAVVAAIVIILPMYLVFSSISEMEAENGAIKEVLREIEQSRTTLRARAAEQAAARARYAQQAPPLATFLEGQATRAQLQLSEVTNEPPVTLGSFTRQRVRASFRQIDLPKIMSLLDGIASSQYPVSIEKIEIDHPRGAETFNLRIGIDSYARTPGEEGAGRSGQSGGQSRPRTGGR